jgi:hypothetical protein
MLLLLATLLLVPVVSLGLTEKVAAQQTNFTGLKLRRPSGQSFVYEFQAQPGQKLKGEFLAQHDYEEQDLVVKFYLIPSDFYVDPENGSFIYPEKDFYLDDEYSLARWISFEKESITLSRYGQEEIIRFNINIPNSARPGSYFAALVLSDVSPAQFRGEEAIPQTSTGATIGTRLSPIVLVTIPGQSAGAINFNSIDVLGQDLNKPLLGIHEYLPVVVRTKLSNDSNFVTVPSGNIFIHQGDEGSPVATLTFNPNAGRLLPGTTRPYFNDWSDASVIYKVNQSFPGGGHLTVNPEGSGGFRIGRYFVTAKVRYTDLNGQVKLVTYTETFWVIPWKLLLVLLLLIVIIAWVIYRRVTADKPKKTRKTRSQSRG